MTTPLVWSERNDPNAPGGAWRDCTYSAGLTALVFGGKTTYEHGLYSVQEREDLERSDKQPDETGASLDDLILAVRTRYGIAWTKSPVALLDQHHARRDLGFIIGGNNGNLPDGHTLRRWDKAEVPHRVFIVPTGDGVHVKWYDPEAPNKYAGDTTDWATVKRWMGTVDGYFIVVRSNAYKPVVKPPVAPPTPPPPAPKTYTEAEMAAVKAQLAEALAVKDQLTRSLTESNNNLSAALQRISAAKAALG